MSLNRRAVMAGLGALAVAPALPKLPIAAEVEAPLFAVDWGAAVASAGVWMQAGRVFFVSQANEVFEVSEPLDPVKWS